MEIEASPHSQNPPSGGFGRGPTSNAFGPTDGPAPAPSRLRPFLAVAVVVLLLSTIVMFLLTVKR